MKQVSSFQTNINVNPQQYLNPNFLGELLTINFLMNYVEKTCKP